MFKTVYKKAVGPNALMYQSLGWTVDGDSAECRVFSKLPSKYVSIELSPSLMPGTIRRPIGAFKSATLFGAVAFEQNHFNRDGYTFALPDTLSANYAVLFSFCVWPVCLLRNAEITGYLNSAEYDLHVFSHFSDAEFAVYRDNLKTFFEARHDEPGRFQIFGQDVWFDLASGALMSFDKQFMSNAASLIQKSFLAQVVSNNT
jgi:hypothetical protein